MQKEEEEEEMKETTCANCDVEKKSIKPDVDRLARVGEVFVVSPYSLSNEQVSCFAWPAFTFPSLGRL